MTRGSKAGLPGAPSFGRPTTRREGTGAAMDDASRSVTARGQQARDNLVAALRECCLLADGVEELEGSELLEVLVYLDSLRFVMAESGQLLQGVLRGHEG